MPCSNPKLREELIERIFTQTPWCDRETIGKLIDIACENFINDIESFVLEVAKIINLNNQLK